MSSLAWQLICPDLYRNTSKQTCCLSLLGRFCNRKKEIKASQTDVGYLAAVPIIQRDLFASGGQLTLELRRLLWLASLWTGAVSSVFILKTARTETCALWEAHKQECLLAVQSYRNEWEPAQAFCLISELLCDRWDFWAACGQYRTFLLV